MADQTVITDPPEEKKEKPPVLEIREKSFQQLIKEQAGERSKPQDPIETEEEKAAKVKEDEEKKAKDAEAAKVEQEANAKLEQDRQADLAKKAAEEVVKKQEEAKQAELDRVKAEESEKARLEALKPKFTGVDEKGNVTPKDYDEIVAETKRIAKEEVLAEIEAREKTRTEEANKIAQDKATTEEQVKAQRQAFDDQLQKELDADLNDLYAGNKLPKIKDPNNENDPGIKEQRNLFEIAQKVNADRMAKGEPPIRSIKLIYYEHYKPLAKPAGHDAPVLGAESSISNEPSDDKYIPSRDRNKSMAQLVKEEALKLAKKAGIRGN